MLRTQSSFTTARRPNQARCPVVFIPNRGAKKEDPGPEPEVLTGQDYTSCVDHHLITTSQDFECHSLGGVDTPDLRDWPLRLREARGAGGP